jgi:polyhydroxyalkanoate synthase
MAKTKQNKTNPADNHASSPAADLKFSDPVALGHALADVYLRAQPLFQEFWSRHARPDSGWNPDPMNVGKSYADFVSTMMADPDTFWHLQQDYWQRWMQLWHESALKFLGETGKTVIEPKKGDRRFADQEWQQNALFDFIKQSYLLTCEWMDKSVRGAQGLDEKQREKLAFHARLFADALSPSNFLMTNPEVLRETLKSGGENLIRGLENLVGDLERGHGMLKISTTKYDAFTLGKNIATTPGKIVYQNDLMQLIQYEPATEKVFAQPLLIVPPWINKYYILDLRPDNSLIRWAVEQGHTVFAVSWVNPTPKLARKRFEDYMSEGILEALEQMEKITGADQSNIIGYCLGGTLLAITLAWLQEKKQAQRVASATFLTTLLDFENSGDMKLFLDDEQLALMEQKMTQSGVFAASQLQQTFSLLRANDLIWSFVVNNYLMGKEPFPFDLLYWNDDSTNMPAAMHSFYLRAMYRDNLLTKPGGIAMGNVPIDITKIRTPAYFLSTREDHIAPWKATYAGTQMLGGPVTFTLAASGHIAGVVNGPAKNKYCFWSAEKTPADPDAWLETATEKPGSWWPHWQAWVKNYTGEKIPARAVGPGLEDAPGSYVMVKSD